MEKGSIREQRLDLRLDHRRAEAELDGTDLQIVGDLVDLLFTRFGGGFTRERRSNGILSLRDSTYTNKKNGKDQAESARKRRRISFVTHVGVVPVD